MCCAVAVCVPQNPPNTCWPGSHTNEVPNESENGSAEYSTPPRTTLNCPSAIESFVWIVNTVKSISVETTCSVVSEIINVTTATCHDDFKVPSTHLLFRLLYWCLCSVERHRLWSLMSVQNLPRVSSSSILQKYLYVSVQNMRVYNNNIQIYSFPLVSLESYDEPDSAIVLTLASHCSFPPGHNRLRETCSEIWLDTSSAAASGKAAGMANATSNRNSNDFGKLESEISADRRQMYIRSAVLWRTWCILVQRGKSGLVTSGHV